MSLNGISENSRSYLNLVDNSNADVLDSWNFSVINQDLFFQNGHSLRPLICRPYRLWQRILLCRLTRKISFRHLVLFICPLVTFIIFYLGIFSDSSVDLFKRYVNLIFFYCGSVNKAGKMGMILSLRK